MPLSQGYKYVLVKICVLPHWVETSPCKRATALMVGKLLKRLISNPQLGNSIELHRNWGTYFTEPMIKSICHIWLIYSIFIVLIPPVLWIGRVYKWWIKTQRGTFSEAFNLPWPKALPVVLLSLRHTPFGKPGFLLISHCSPYVKGHNLTKRRHSTLLSRTYQLS